MKVSVPVWVTGGLQDLACPLLDRMGFCAAPLPPHGEPILQLLVVGSDSSTHDSLFRSIVPRLGRRAKVFVLAPWHQLVVTMLALSDVHLEPKRLHVESSSEPWILISAAVAKRGGLAISQSASDDQA